MRKRPQVTQVTRPSRVPVRNRMLKLLPCVCVCACVCVDVGAAVPTLWSLPRSTLTHTFPPRVRAAQALRRELAEAHRKTDHSLMNQLDAALRRAQRLASDKSMLEMQLEASTEAEQEMAQRLEQLEGTLTHKVADLETRLKASVATSSLESAQAEVVRACLCSCSTGHARFRAMPPFVS